MSDDLATKEDVRALHQRLDAALAPPKDIPLSSIRVSLLGVLTGLLALGTPTGLVIASHYRVTEHLQSSQIHVDRDKASLLGGVAYAAEVAEKERRTYFMLRSLHCGNPNAAPALCSSAYPDGAFPVIPPVPASSSGPGGGK